MVDPRIAPAVLMARDSWNELHVALMTSGLFVAPVWMLLHASRLAGRAILRGHGHDGIKR